MGSIDESIAMCSMRLKVNRASSGNLETECGGGRSALPPIAGY